LSKRTSIKKIYFALAALIISLSFLLPHSRTPHITQKPVREAPLKTPVNGTEPAEVIRVHDGDTVTLSYKGSKYRVRLIGIDAPELGQKPWGRISKNHLKEILPDRIKIEMDVQSRDRYGRLLAYLRDENGTLINQKMVEDGYAVLLTIPPNVKHVDELKEAQRKAREAGRGLWGEDGLKESPSDYRKRR
jgi:micrococcal nuclease